MKLTWPPKKSAEELDYKIDWSRVLVPLADTITTSVWEITSEAAENLDYSELVLYDESNNATTTQVWLSGGFPGPARINNTITTEDGRTFVATVSIIVQLNG
jgi:hypothetical protein